MIIFGKEAKELLEYRNKFWNEQKENLILRGKIDHLETENERLKAKLAKIEPVIETSGWKPAITDKCEYCDYAYFSDYDGELLGCCKGMVCEDFSSRQKKEED